MALSLDIVKILILASLLITTFVFGIIPVIFIRYIEKASASQPRTVEEEQQRKKYFSRYWRILSFLNCFAAGVFLATCLLELLPGVRHNLIKALFSSKIYTGFPLAEFVMVCGLFFILIVEQIALSVKENSVSDYTIKNDTTDSDIRRPLLSKQTHETDEEKEEEKLASIHNDHFLGGISDEPEVPIMHEVRSNDYEQRQGQIMAVPSIHATNSNPRDTPRDGYSSNGNRTSSQSVHLIHEQSLTNAPIEQNLHVHSVFRSMFLLFALSLHAIFEGLAVGLQTETEDVLSIFAALVVHKSILSFSLGMNLMQSKISVKSAIKSIILFSISAPIGTLIGIVIIDFWDTTKSGVVHGVLQGIASGTFLYIIFFEILPKEFNGKMDRLLKVLFLIIGYSVITGIIFLGDDVKHPFCLINEKGDHP